MKRARRMAHKHNGSAHQGRCRPIRPGRVREQIVPTVASGHARVMFKALSSYPMMVDRVFVPRGCDADLCPPIKAKHGRLRYDQRRWFFLRTESGLAGCWTGSGRLGDMTASLTLEGQGCKHSGEDTPARADSSQYSRQASLSQETPFQIALA
jgi:hypothetical protein